MYDKDKDEDKDGENDCKGGAVFWLWVWWVLMMVFFCGACTGVYVISALKTIF